MFRRLNREKAELGKTRKPRRLIKTAAPLVLALTVAGCGEVRQQSDTAYQEPPLPPVLNKTPTQYAKERAEMLAQGIVDLSKDPNARRLPTARRRLIFSLPINPANPQRELSREQLFGVSTSGVKLNGDPDPAKFKHVWLNSDSLQADNFQGPAYLFDVHRDHELGGLDLYALYSRSPKSKSSPIKLCYNTAIEEPLGSYLPADAGTINRIMQDANAILRQAEEGQLTQPLSPPARLGAIATQKHPGCR